MPILSLLLMIDGSSVDLRAISSPEPSADTPLDALLRRAIDLAVERAGEPALPPSRESLALIEAALAEISPEAHGALVRLSAALGLPDPAPAPGGGGIVERC